MASSGRPFRYGKWSRTSLEKALAELEKGTIRSVRRAALMYGIPRSTLHDHYSGKIEIDAKPGPPPYLSVEEEEELSNFLMKCARIGYPKTRQQVLAIVQEILEKRRPDVNVTNGWWERFSKRHENVCLKSAIPLSYVRAMAEDESSLDEYYNLLETTLRENEIFDRPSHIFNCDETGMPLNPVPLKVVSERGAKNPSNICGSSKSQVTILACCSATGHTFPPYVVLARKTLNHDITYNEVPGSVYGLSPKKGWMDLELFTDWFKRSFLPYAPAARPLLLLMDGHKSHFCPDMIKTAAKEGVILFALPPHTTHLCQPLDKGPFAPLKVEWRKAVQRFVSEQRGREVTIYDFNTVFKDAWYNALTANNILAGFRITGVFPFNRNAVKARSSKFEKFDPESLSRDTKITFIPLFSPLKSKHHPCPKDSEEDSDGYDDYDDAFLSEMSPFMGSGLDRSLSDSTLDKCHTLHAVKPRNLKEFLVTPSAPKRSRGRGPIPKGRVLTSRDNLLLLEEQERKKQEAADMKEQRRKAREMKKAKQKSKSSANAFSQSTTNITSPLTKHEDHSDFSAQEIAKFNRRLEKGYDLPDPRYELWLEMSKEKDLEDQDDGGESPIKEAVVPSQSKGRCGALSNGDTKRGVSTSVAETRLTRSKGRGGGMDTTFFEGACIDGACEHPRATNWLYCDCCGEAFHCVCVGIEISEAELIEFVCGSCDQY